MNKQQKNYIKAVVGFVLAAIILCAGIMTALYLMREEKGMENLMAPVLKRLIAGILLFGLTVCWRHFLKKSVSKVAGIIAIVLLSLFFAWHISGIPQEKALKPQNVNLEKAEFRGYEINGNHFLIKEARPFIKYKMQSSKIANVKVYFAEPVAQDTDVKISYQTKEKPTYEQNPRVWANIKKGEKIAFVGESGSGKSTLIKILLGLLKYNQGEVRLGDMELKEICLNNLYDRVSYLSQDAPVFDGTIKQNLVFEKQVSVEQMLGVLSEVQLSHLVENLAEGLNTEIGEKGTCLSGGEKQRLALARLWFEDSELVILDEATSAMDNLTEENVMKSVMQKMKDKTVIAIAHRLNSIAGFDRIILFREGKIVGQGTFEELLRTDSYFMDLYNANVQ